MGAVCASQKQPEVVVSDQINQTLKADFKARSEVILLLGPGSAGKSTFCRQLVPMKPNSRADNDKIITETFCIISNILDAVQQIVSWGKENNVTFGLSLEDQSFVLTEANTKIDDRTVSIIQTIHKAKEFQKMVEEADDASRMVCGISGADYFFSNIKRIAEPNYVRSNEDRLRLRLKTSGVQEYDLEVHSNKLKIVDVGGQRSERKKWIKFFDSATLVIFLVAINEYDRTLEEDEDVNRLFDALVLWVSVTKALNNIPWILFLNKSDLFEKKIKKVPLSTIFSEWDVYIEKHAEKGKSEFDLAWGFFAWQFNAKFKGSSSLRIFLTSALDTAAMAKIWDSIVASILRSAIGSSPML